jgi:hypothetical protein
MRLRLAFRWIFLAAAALAAAVAAMVFTVDTDQVRWLIVQQVESASGRALQIKGKIGLKVSLTPSILLNDVTLANAPWGSRPDMARIRRIEAQIALRPLLLGRIEISRMALIEPDILFERNAEGQTNWSFGQAGQAGPAPELHIARFSLDDGRITYRAPGGEYVLGIDSLTMLAKGDATSVEASAAYGGHTIDIKGDIGSLAQLQRQTKPFPLALAIGIDRIEARANGSIGDIASFGKLDVRLDLDFPEASEPLSWFDIQLEKSLGPAQIGLTVQEVRGKLQASQIEATIGSQDSLLVSAQGSIGDLLAGTGIDLQTSVEILDLSEVSELAGYDLPAIGPIAARFALSRSGESWRMSRMSALIGGSELAGDALVTFAARPLVKASLGALVIDTADFLPRDQAQDPEDGRLFSAQPFPLDWMQALDMDLDLKASRLLVPNLVLWEVETRFHLRDGKAALAPFSFDVATGRVNGYLEVDATQDPAAIVVQATGESVRIGTLLSEMAVTTAIRDGQIDFNLYLGGKGPSLRDFMAGADGRLQVAVGPALLEDANADLMVVDLMGLLVPWGPNLRNTQMRCLVGFFDVTRGLAETEALLFDTSRMTVIGEGRIDLGSERIQLTLVPEAKEFSLTSLAATVTVEGTLAKPDFQPSAEGLVRNLFGMLGRIVFPPLGLLSLFASADGHENPCLAAVGQLKEKNAVKPKEDETKPAAPEPEVPKQNWNDP